jgi:protoheme IX farnesyltransferase
VISSDPCGAVHSDAASPSDTQARPLAGTLAAFLELSKPGVGGLVVTTTLCGALTAPVTMSLGRLSAALLGTSLVVGAANGLNMVIERKSDALMSRTRLRPLPTRRLSPELALLFCAVSSVLGTALLLAFVGNLAALLTLSALVSYVVAYTPLKRVTPLALFVGAVPGAIPPLIGWAAATGTLAPLAWLEFAVLYVWQLPHFLAIAIFRKEEYARAGMRVLSVSHGVRRSKIEIALYSLLLVGVSLLPVGLKLAGMGYALVALTCGLAFLALATAGLSMQDDRRWARRVFFASMPYLVIVLSSLAVFASS